MEIVTEIVLFVIMALVAVTALIVASVALDKALNIDIIATVSPTASTALTVQADVHTINFPGSSGFPIAHTTVTYAQPFTSKPVLITNTIWDQNLKTITTTHIKDQSLTKFDIAVDSTFSAFPTSGFNAVTASATRRPIVLQVTNSSGVKVPAMAYLTSATEVSYAIAKDVNGFAWESPWVVGTVASTRDFVFLYDGNGLCHIIIIETASLIKHYPFSPSAGTATGTTIGTVTNIGSRLSACFCDDASTVIWLACTATASTYIRSFTYTGTTWTASSGMTLAAEPLSISAARYSSTLWAISYVKSDGTELHFISFPTIPTSLPTGTDVTAFTSTMSGSIYSGLFGGYPFISAYNSTTKFQFVLIATAASGGTGTWPTTASTISSSSGYSTGAVVSVDSVTGKMLISFTNGDSTGYLCYGAFTSGASFAAQIADFGNFTIIDSQSRANTYNTVAVIDSSVSFAFFNATTTTQIDFFRNPALSLLVNDNISVEYAAIGSV